MAEAELLELFEKANTAARKACSNVAHGDEGAAVVDASAEARCTDALRAIGAVHVSTALLLSTQVGKRLRKLTKHASMKISKSAQDILQDWRKVVSTEANASDSKNPASRKATSNGGNTDVAAPNAKLQVKSSKVVAQVKMVEVKVSKVSVVSSSSVRQFGANIPRAAGDSSARDRIREMLVDALGKVCEEATGEELQHALAVNVVDVAVAVESALFAKLGLSKGKEKAKYRSIMFNIKDEKNPDFRRRIVLGRVSPEAIVTMSTDDMASEHRKKQTRDIQAKAMFECERGLVQATMASTDQFKCRKCLQRKTTYFQMQTRSADGPMTTFITCLNCNAHWKF